MYQLCYNGCMATEKPTIFAPSYGCGKPFNVDSGGTNLRLSGATLPGLFIKNEGPNTLYVKVNGLVFGAQGRDANVRSVLSPELFDVSAGEVYLDSVANKVELSLNIDIYSAVPNLDLRSLPAKLSILQGDTIRMFKDPANLAAWCEFPLDCVTGQAVIRVLDYRNVFNYFDTYTPDGSQGIRIVRSYSNMDNQFYWYKPVELLTNGIAIESGDTLNLYGHPGKPGIYAVGMVTETGTCSVSCGQNLII